MSQTLFDSFVRTDGEPARAEEDSFAFLNRAATPYWERVRTFVDQAFAAYPESDAADLRPRFQSRRWSDHVGAWWELYLFTLLQALGLEVEVHPDLPGVATRPDFRASDREGPFFIEARHVAAGIMSDARTVGRDGWITGPLDELAHADFMVGVRILDRAAERPRRRAVTAGVLAWLDSLDRDEVAARPPRDFPTFVGNAGGWRFELSALPVKPRASGGGRRRLVGIYPGASGYDNTSPALRAALKEKAAKYGRPESPFVLAPLLTSGFTSNDDVVSALYGSEAVTFPIGDPSQGKLVRRRDGFWVSGEGFRGTRISAVLLGQSVLPWTVSGPLPRLWIHPSAARPLPSHFGLPTARLDDAGMLQLSDDDRTGADVFGLAPDWPGPEAPFEPGEHPKP